MECPLYGFDRVFSFANNGGNNISKLFVEGVRGNVKELEYEDYVRDFKEEGREIKAYPLNLSLDERARLWEVLDSLKVSPVRPFNIVDSHCFSVISEAVEIAVAPSKILWDEPPYQNNSYSENTFKSGGENYPWNYMMIMLTFGNMADESGSGRGFVYPTTFEFSYDKFRIVTNDSVSRPLIAGAPQILMEEKGNHAANRPTPVELSLIILGIVAVITTFQFLGKWRMPGKILDWTLWVIVTAGGLFILFITYAPIHYGGNWNWPLIVMNPIAWIPVAIFSWTKNKAFNLKCIWIIYAVVLVLFAAFVRGISPSIDSSWRLFAIALAVRCVWHITLYSKPKVPSKMNARPLEIKSK